MLSFLVISATSPVQVSNASIGGEELGGEDRDLGGLLLLAVCVVANVTVSGEVSFEAWKPGIHFSNAALTSSRSGLIWSSRPQNRIFMDLVPPLGLTRQSWQMRMVGISLILEHSPVLHFESLERQVQHACHRHRDLLFLGWDMKNSLHSLMLCFSWSLIGQVHRGSLAGGLDWTPCLSFLSGFLGCLGEEEVLAVWVFFLDCFAGGDDSSSLSESSSSPAWWVLAFGLGGSSVVERLAWSSRAMYLFFKIVKILSKCARPSTL